MGTHTGSRVIISRAKHLKTVSTMSTTARLTDTKLTDIKLTVHIAPH